MYAALSHVFVFSILWDRESYFTSAQISGLNQFEGLISLLQGLTARKWEHKNGPELIIPFVLLSTMTKKNPQQLAHPKLQCAVHFDYNPSKIGKTLGQEQSRWQILCWRSCPYQGHQWHCNIRGEDSLKFYHWMTNETVPINVFPKLSMVKASVYIKQLILVASFEVFPRVLLLEIQEKDPQRGEKLRFLRK